MSKILTIKTQIKKLESAIDVLEQVNAPVKLIDDIEDEIMHLEIQLNDLIN